MRFLFYLPLYFFGSILLNAQETAVVSLTTSQDVVIQSQNIQADIQLLAFGSETGQEKSRSILKFDLDDLPTGKLKEATLSLTMASNGSGIVSLHKVTSNWSGSTFNATDYATWETTGIGNNSWNTQGGDFSNLPSARAVFRNNETLDLFGPRMGIDIEEWIENPSSNFGWIIIGSENTPNNRTEFHSGKNLTQGPILTLIYELPDSCYAHGGYATTRGGQTKIAKCSIGEEIIVDLKVRDDQGENNIWLICDKLGEILGFSINSLFKSQSYGEQNLNLYHLSFNGEILGASLGGNIRNLVGCHQLSNKIEILNSPIYGGDITTTAEDVEVTICPFDLKYIEDLTIKNHIGISSIWVVLDNAGVIKILDTQRPKEIIDLPAGNYEIRHLSYQGNILGLIVGNTIDEVIGCHSWSNKIDITLLEKETCRLDCALEGSTIKGRGLDICPSFTIGASFDTDSLILSNNYGPFAIWILTDHRGNTIEAIPDVSLSSYQVSEGETVYLFHVTYSDLTFKFRNNIYNLIGCYGISNGFPITGTYTEGCPVICDLPNANIASFLSSEKIDLCQISTIGDLALSSNVNNSFPSRYIIRDERDSIISIGDDSMKLQFEEDGNYSISQVLAYEDSAFSILNNHVLNSNTCYSFSNRIILVQGECPFICQSPDHFNIQESSNGDLLIRWDRIEDASDYEFEIGLEKDTTELIKFTTNRNWIKLSNPSNRSLIFRARTICSEENYSLYSDFVHFTSTLGTIATSRTSKIISKSHDVSISPNPASNRITIKHLSFEENVVAEIYNTSGILQYKQALDIQSTEHDINISDLEAGLHVVILRNQRGVLYQERFIKIR